jgi:MFS family permease
MIALVFGRVLQGIGAAGQQTVGIIVILDLTTQDNRGFWLGALHSLRILPLH